MRDGKPVLSLPDVETARRHARAALESLSEAQRSFQPAPYPVTVSPALRDLAADVDRRLAHG